MSQNHLPACIRTTLRQEYISYVEATENKEKIEELARTYLIVINAIAEFENSINM
jgi:hypothetical protein